MPPSLVMRFYTILPLARILLVLVVVDFQPRPASVGPKLSHYSMTDPLAGRSSDFHSVGIGHHYAEKNCEDQSVVGYESSYKDHPVAGYASLCVDTYQDGHYVTIPTRRMYYYYYYY